MDTNQPNGRDVLRRAERRVLRSHRRRIRGRDGLLALGAPSARGVKWCRAALEYLIEIDSWAPEIDWDSTLPAVLQFSRRTDARWAVHAAQVAGLQASRVEAPGELFRVRVE